MFLFRRQPKIGPDAIDFPCKVDNRLESYVTRLLEEAGIPSFIWGEAYLSILGSSTGIFVGHFSSLPGDQIANKKTRILAI